MPLNPVLCAMRSTSSESLLELGVDVRTLTVLQSLRGALNGQLRIRSRMLMTSLDADSAVWMTEIPSFALRIA